MRLFSGYLACGNRVGCWVVDEEHGGAFLTAGYAAQVGRCITLDMAEGLEALSEMYLSRRIMAIYLFRKWHPTRTFWFNEHDCLTATCPSENNWLLSWSTMSPCEPQTVDRHYCLIWLSTTTNPPRITSNTVESQQHHNVCETNRRSHDGHG